MLSGKIAEWLGVEGYIPTSVLGREHGGGLDGTFPTVSLSGRVMPTEAGRKGTQGEARQNGQGACPS